MIQTCKLLDLPESIAKSTTQNQIQISGENIAALNDSGELKIFSIIQKSIILTESNVDSFSWISASSIEGQILVLLANNSFKFIIFSESIPESLPFDTYNRSAPFSLTKINQYCSVLCEFKPAYQIKQFIPSDINTLVVLDDDDKLHRFLVYPDGIYQSSLVSAQGCTKFAFSGLYLAGLSETDVHIWSSNLLHLCAAPTTGTFLCATEFTKFAVINEQTAEIVDFTGNKETTLELPAKTCFISIFEGNHIAVAPEDCVIASQTHFLPIFATEKELLTFDKDCFLQRLAAVFPSSVSIPILSLHGGSDEIAAMFIAETALTMDNAQLVESYLVASDPQTTIIFLNCLIALLIQMPNRSFAESIKKTVTSFCIQKISSTIYPDGFSSVLVKFRNLFLPDQSGLIKKICPPPPPQPVLIREDELLKFVLDALESQKITEALPSLQISFREYSPFQLFRTIVLQQAWMKVCTNHLNEAQHLITLLGENPLDHFYEMWRNTTRNGTRQLLYDFLSKNDRISPQDEQNHQTLLKITKKFPNTSFTSAQKLSASPGVRAVDDTKLPPWQPIVDLNADFNENRSMIFQNLFSIPNEPPVENPHYFLGNIALIEAQTPETLKMLNNEVDAVEKLWLLHCEHRINDMAQEFQSEIERSKGVDRSKLKCIKFVDKYHAQMNTYELETLLDILCRYGYFAQFEYDDFELLLVRICKSKYLFDQNWWENQSKLDFKQFFKNFARFCAKKSLFMPFEMFVISHPEAKKIDMRDIDEPLIRFIWDLWVRRNPSDATLSCMQFIAKSNSTNPVELWEKLPSDSLAPLASYVWNKDPEKFKPGSPETEALSNRLKNEYPLLSSLVKGEIPHPEGPVKEPPASRWRSPIYTSKYDLELHDLIQSHFTNYDFSKVFTDYYGKTPGQPNFPHFDHPELITAPSEPPYVHYVKSMLPVSAFQQAVDDGVGELQFKELCIQCMKEALGDKQIRLAALSFIELVDIKFKVDRATDYKLVIAIYDILNKTGITERLVDQLTRIFARKDKETAKDLQRQLAPNEIELFLLSTLLGVRCGLPLDYSAIIAFAETARSAELLLFVDRAAELGAHYPISEIVKIVTDKMPRDNPLKTHLLFHLSQSLPNEEGPTSTDIPGLVVFRAVRRKDQPPHISLLQEALNRKVQLYALLATSVDGADLLLCALVTILTMLDGPSTFDVTQPPPHEEMVSLFLDTISQLLSEKKSLELMQTLELFSDSSVIVNLIHFYRAIELFSFRRAEQVLPELNVRIQDKQIVNDDLLGEVSVKSITNIFYPMLESLVNLCAERSQIHVFRFLQVLDNTVVSPFLEPRVKLCKVISDFENFRRAVVHCNLLGEPDKIVSDLVLNHSLQLGQAAAECLGISAAAATKQWLTFQYSNAATPAQVLEIHQEIVPSIQNADAMFFVYLFASLLPYAQPTTLMPIIEYAQSINKDELKHLDTLLLHLKICKENALDVQQGPGALPSLADLLTLLFPGQSFPDAPQQVPLSIASPVLFGLDTLQRYFESSVDKVIDVCLDKRESDNAHLVCEWRNRDPHNIQLLEAVQGAIAGEELSPENSQLVESFGGTGDMDALLQNIAKQNGWRFVLISLHYRAAKLLDLPTTNLLHRKTSEFIESKLSVTFSSWPLVRELIATCKMAATDVAVCLGRSYAQHLRTTIAAGKECPDNMLNPNDYGEKFLEFTKLCDTPTAVGERFFEIAKRGQKGKAKMPLTVTVNLLLHSSLCTTDIDESAEMLDSLLEDLTNDACHKLVIDIVSYFPDPALIPRFFQYLIAQEKLDDLPHSNLNEKVGRVIMNCARHHHPFEPQKYFELTLKYNLFRDHAELQMERGNKLLEGNPDKLKLQDASRHFLLALAYFLHEKCYSLSMECLKKLSLISLQIELSEPPILHLEKTNVQKLMNTKDFPFALTVAVAYDMDNETNWAEAIYNQSVVKQGEEFLTAFQYFRPITSSLCDGVVKKYKAAKVDDETQDRMKAFLTNIPNLVERYRIAKSLDFKDQIDNMKTHNPVVCEWCERVLMSKQ
ncbi:hypothetical protein TRFO_16115 [Tritrichomonas foetus]|uniref:Spatacsin C-terminal domain-containing protein n=1 Tax=Tritrichomonas foetus TaxID=1144522 RepID=A0A1J4KQX5_9EUKA|nr:hypothetical protein TRFO_16115 [Tritrichomonas foetus]|eukprot:OHT13681.1 hypothetical protein TRFO_16115 [Tritrichomonas foetus]